MLDGQRVTARFRELEVELLDGDEETLRRLEQALREAGAGAGRLHAEALSRPRSHVPAGRRPSWPPTHPPADVLRAALVAQYAQLLAHDPGTRLGTDPEDLHQMRVATRRARAFLRAARPLLDAEWAEGLRDELGWLGSALGPARDLDVLLEHVRGEVADLGDEGSRSPASSSRSSDEHERTRAVAVAALATTATSRCSTGSRTSSRWSPPTCRRDARRALVGRVQADAQRAFEQARRRLAGRRAARGADPRQARALLPPSWPRRELGTAGRDVRRRREAAPGRPRRAPGRGRRRGADRRVGRRRDGQCDAAEPLLERERERRQAGAGRVADGVEEAREARSRERRVEAS